MTIATITQKLKQQTAITHHTSEQQLADTYCCGIHSQFKHILPENTLDYYQDWLAIRNFDQKRHQFLTADYQAKVINQETPLYIAMRDVDGVFDLQDTHIKQQIDAVHQQMQTIQNQLQANNITDVVHIGIGGSVFGSQLAYQALADYRLNEAPTIHYISYMDQDLLLTLLKQLNPKTTVFILVSKSFTTEEMLYQAKLARAWLLDAKQDITQHTIAVTAQIDKAQVWGVNDNWIVPLWPWVGGRFSVWSGVSLSLVLAIGMENFKAFLCGAHTMDQHFLQSNLSDNMSIQLAILSSWYTEFCKHQCHAVIPYNAKLELLPLYLQQLHMESLGKSIDITGQPVAKPATPVIFGDIGTRSQHALSQYFMQAPQFTPLDIIAINRSHNESEQRLFAHANAQSDVLWQGYNNTNVYKTITGKRAHTLLSIEALSPHSLGALLAMYEHKIYTLAVLYNLNAFDQWGVERGKVIAEEFYQALAE